MAKPLPISMARLQVIIIAAAIFVSVSLLRFNGETEKGAGTGHDYGTTAKKKTVLNTVSSSPARRPATAAASIIHDGGDSDSQVFSESSLSESASAALSEFLFDSDREFEGTVETREARDDGDTADAVCGLSTTDYGAASGLHSIVTGLETSGTRVVGQLIMSSPGVFGLIDGPGCGVLLARTPSDYRRLKPFYQRLTSSTDAADSWRLSEDRKSSMPNATCHAEMHSLLRHHSPVMRDTAPADSRSRLVDMTPRYVHDLVQVMDRSPGVPVVVTERHDIDHIAMLRKTLGGGREASKMSAAMMANAMDMVDRAIRKYPDRVHVVNVTRLYVNPSDVMRDIYDFLKLEWSPDYLSMEALNRKLRAIGFKEVPPFLPHSSGGADGRAAPAAAAGSWSGRGDGVRSVEGGKSDDATVDACELSKTDFRAASGLHAIVAGCEHSGTTITSQLIMSAPGVFGAYECGMHLAKTPARFKFSRPFFKWLMSEEVWGLTEEQASDILSSSCHAEMYVRLKQYSPVYGYPNNASMIIDKTPRYVLDLVRIMDQTPGVPVVVTQKSDEDQKRSFLKRGAPERRVLPRIAKSKEMLSKALKKYPERIYVVNTTLLYEDPNLVMSRVFDFLGLTWDPEFLTMKALNAKKSAVGLRETLPFNLDASNKTAGTTQRFVGKSKERWID